MVKITVDDRSMEWSDSDGLSGDPELVRAVREESRRMSGVPLSWGPGEAVAKGHLRHAGPAFTLMMIVAQRIEGDVTVAGDVPPHDYHTGDDDGE